MARQPQPPPTNLVFVGSNARDRSQAALDLGEQWQTGGARVFAVERELADQTDLADNGCVAGRKVRQLDLGVLAGRGQAASDQSGADGDEQGAGHGDCLLILCRRGIKLLKCYLQKYVYSVQDLRDEKVCKCEAAENRKPPTRITNIINRIN